MAGRMYQRGLLKEAESKMIQSFYFKWIGAAEDDNPSDESLGKSKPSYTQRLVVENLRRRYKSLPINEFQRYHLNQWTRNRRRKLDRNRKNG